MHNLLQEKQMQLEQIYQDIEVYIIKILTMEKGHNKKQRMQKLEHKVEYQVQ